MAIRRLTRREFVAGTSAAAAGAMIVPRRVLGGVGYQAPSDTLNIAIIGAGGQGTENAQELLTENIVAVCDVDFAFADRSVENRTKERDGKPRPAGVQWKEVYSKATRYQDFREMLEKQRDIDAVVICTPDHQHAIMAKTAMELGKHVYVQKPLTYSVREARVLAQVARQTGVVTQMGNQGHSMDGARVINEWVQAGVIGPVREVYVWTNRPIWPQGIPRPGEGMLPQDPNAPPSWNQRAVQDRVALALAGSYRPPTDMRWDLYLGGVKNDLAYHPIYHPFNWRGWLEFGVGALGDMGAHLIDHPYWALGLTYPTSIEASSTPWGGGNASPASYPQSMVATYEFPARRNQPAVRLYWYDGGLFPPRPDRMPPDVQLNPEGGVMFVGDRGVLTHETYGRNPKLYPESLMERAQRVKPTYPRIPDKHEMNWVKACKGEGAPTCPFDYAAPLTEVMLLGIVALRTGQARKILYDAQNMQVTNVPEANQYLTREYRAGWEV